MLTYEELIRAVPSLEAADIERVQEMEVAAVAFIETQTRRYFGALRDTDETVIGKGTGKLYLSQVPTWVSDLDYAESVVVEERCHAGDTPTIVTDFDIRVMDGEVALVRHSGLCWRRDYEYTVRYRSGYEPGLEPADIRQLVIDLVSSRFVLAESEGLQGETMGGYSYTAFAPDDLNLITGANDTIDAYRRVVVA